MKIINVLENIKAEDVISVCIETGASSGKPMICVETNSQGEIQQEITNGFELHYCNEFLRSLNLYPTQCISFTSYPEYCQTVKHLNHLLEIKRAMEAVSGKTYAEIDILANQVYQMILNCLLNRHHMGKIDYQEALKKRPLTEWVAEAITYFR